MNPDDPAITDAMRRLVVRLAQLGWVQQSLVSNDALHVQLTPLGRTHLRQLWNLLEQIGWPASETDTMCLFGLCQKAAAEPPTSAE